METEISICPYCGKEVISFWTDRGCISDSQYVLVADWVYHSVCWDKQIEEYPPGDC